MESSTDFLELPSSYPLKYKLGLLHNLLEKEKADILEVFRVTMGVLPHAPQTRLFGEAFGYERVNFDWEMHEDGTATGTVFVGFTKVFRGVFRISAKEITGLDKIHLYLPKDDHLRITQTQKNTSYRFATEGVVDKEVQFIQTSKRVFDRYELWTEVGPNSLPQACFWRDLGAYRGWLDDGCDLDIPSFLWFEYESDGSLIPGDCLRDKGCPEEMVAIRLKYREEARSEDRNVYIYRERFPDSCIRHSKTIIHPFYKHLFVASTVITRDGSAFQEVSFDVKGEIQCSKRTDVFSPFVRDDFITKDSTFEEVVKFKLAMDSGIGQLIRLNEPSDLIPLQDQYFLGHSGVAWSKDDDEEDGDKVFLAVDAAGESVCHVDVQDGRYSVTHFAPSQDFPIGVQESDHITVEMNGTKTHWRTVWSMWFGSFYLGVSEKKEGIPEFFLMKEGTFQVFPLLLHHLGVDTSNPVEILKSLSFSESPHPQTCLFQLKRGGSSDWILVHLEEPGHVERFEGGDDEFRGARKSSRVWTKDGKLHNPDGPARKTIDTQEWWLYGERHRVDGPAVECLDATKNEWWYQGFQYPSERVLSKSEKEKIRHLLGSDPQKVAEVLPKDSEVQDRTEKTIIREEVQKAGVDFDAELRAWQAGGELTPDFLVVLRAWLARNELGPDLKSTDEILQENKEKSIKFQSQLAGEIEETIRLLLESAPQEDVEVSVPDPTSLMSVDAEGTERWTLPNGDLHRKDGPAVMWKNGKQEWWYQGKRHRTGAPAVVEPDGGAEWWEFGQKLLSASSFLVNVLADALTKNEEQERVKMAEIDAEKSREALQQAAWEKKSTLEALRDRELEGEEERDALSSIWGLSDDNRNPVAGMVVETKVGGDDPKKPTKHLESLGTVWRLPDGTPHREDGPAMILNDGEIRWMIDGQLHREDGPAVENKYSKEWWVNGQHHREDGPAVEGRDGHQDWWVRGKRHRIDGPAYINPPYEPLWFFEGKKVTEEEHRALVAKLREEGPPNSEPPPHATDMIPIRRIRSGGREVWSLPDGRLHREDGPAVVFPDGSSVWYQFNLHHREDGPAVQFHNGRCEWWVRGRLHRIVGPARIFPDGTKEWWIDGKEVTEEEHEKFFLDRLASQEDCRDFVSQGTRTSFLSKLPRQLALQALDAVVLEIARSTFRSEHPIILDIVRVAAPVLLFQASEDPSFRDHCEEYLRLVLVKHGLHGLHQIKQTLFAPDAVRVIERFADLSHVAEIEDKSQENDVLEPGLLEEPIPV